MPRLAMAIVVSLLLASIPLAARQRKLASGAEAAALLEQAKMAVVKGEYSDAVRHLTTAIEIRGPDAGLYRARADAYMKLQGWARALDDYHRVLALGSGDAALYASRADALQKLGRSEEAVRSYSSSIELQPDDAVPWNNRGLAYLAAGRFREAISDFNQAIRLNPGFAQAWAHRGAAYVRTGDLEGALVNLSRAISLNPRYYEAYRLRAETQVKLGGVRAAIGDYARALEGLPSDANLYLARSAAYVELGDNEKALADRDRAVRLRPDLPEAWIARGGSYHQLGLHDKGLADRSEAIRLNPRLAEAWCARGSAYYLMGDYRKALSDLTKAVELEPGYKEARQILERVRVCVVDEVVRQERGRTVAARQQSSPIEIVEPAPVREVAPVVMPRQSASGAARPSTLPPGPGVAPVARSRQSTAESLRPPVHSHSAPLGRSRTRPPSWPPQNPPPPGANPLWAGLTGHDTLASIATEMRDVLAQQQRQEAGAQGDDSVEWTNFSDRVERICTLIDRAAPVFAGDLKEAPGRAPAIREAGLAMTRACLVRDDARDVPEVRERRAMEQAFDGYLNMSLLKLDSAAAARRARRVRLLCAISGLMAGLLSLAWLRRRESKIIESSHELSRLPHR